MNRATIRLECFKLQYFAGQLNGMRMMARGSLQGVVILTDEALEIMADNAQAAANAITAEVLEDATGEDQGE